MSKYIQHNKKCFACDRQLSKTLIGYHPETMKSYCLDRQRCPGYKNHPGADNLIPIDKERLEHAIEYTFNGPIQEILLGQLGKTSSFRPNPAMIMHLMKHAQENQIMSMNATLLDIVEQHMKEHPYDEVKLEYCGWEVNPPQSFHHKRRTQPAPAPTPTPEPKTATTQPKQESEAPKNDGGFFGDLKI